MVVGQLFTVWGKIKAKSYSHQICSNYLLLQTTPKLRVFKTTTYYYLLWFWELTGQEGTSHLGSLMHGTQMSTRAAVT